MSSRSIWSIDRIPSGATIPSQSVHVSDVNKRVFFLLKTQALLESYNPIIEHHIPRTLFGVSYSPAEMQSGYFTASNDQAYW